MTEIIDGLNAGVMTLNGIDVQLSPLPVRVTYFEHTPSIAHLNGIIEVALAVGATIPVGNGKVGTIASVVTHLKCNIAAAVALRDAINGALLLAQPATEGSEGKAN